MKDDTLETSLERQIADLAADLVTDEPLFLQRLFDCGAGEWAYVGDLCEGIDSALDRLDAVEDDDLDLLVNWTDYSGFSYGAGFCALTFYAEGLGWSTVVIYNKALFEQRQQGQAA